MLHLLLACATPSPTPQETGTQDAGAVVPQFELAMGIEILDLGRGVSVRDVNGDGRADLLSASSERSMPGNSTVQLHLQNVDGSYTHVTQDWGLFAEIDAWGLVPMDHDLDGTLEVLVTGSAWTGVAENQWLSLEGGKASLAPGPAGSCGEGATMGASVTDLNGDGYLDLVMANGSAAQHGGCVDLLWGGPDGLTVAQDVGRGTLQGFGTAAHDLSGDGYPEIVVASGTGVFIYENLGRAPWFELDNPERTFFMRIRQQDVEWVDASLTTLLLDYDQDGDLDVFICTFVEPDDPSLWNPQRLLRNDGDMVFVEVSEQVGVELGPGCMGSGTGDLDLNGYPDLYLGTGGPAEGNDTDNILYLNSGGTFENRTEEAGVVWHGRTHGIAIVDINGDGHMDLIANSGGAIPGQEEGLRVALNTGGPYSGVVVSLVGTPLNPTGVGTRLVAETDVGTFYVWNLRGQGFGSTNLGPQLVGVADATTVVVHAEFPDGTTTSSQTLHAPFQAITLEWQAAAR